VKFAGASTSTIKCGGDKFLFDGGATSTLTKSVENSTHIRPKVAEIQTAGGATSIYTTYVCLKTCFVRDRTGTIRPIVVKAYIAPALRYALLSVKGLNKSGYRVIHDEDDLESGVYAVINRNRTLRKSFAFLCTQVFFPEKQMNAQQFETQSGYELWHRRMAHSTNQNIRESISCTPGMKSLIGQKYESHIKCASCMIGKASLEDFQSLKRKVVPPFIKSTWPCFHHQSSL
jgi:hypothetical protein